MISPKKLIKMARKWQKLATIRRKRIALPRTSATVDKGNFVVYMADKRRLVIPLVYLKNEIFRELLEMAEEEYGLPSDWPITLLCDTAFMEYAVSLIQSHAAKDVRKSLQMSITSGRCISSSYIQQGQSSQPLLICSF